MNEIKNSIKLAKATGWYLEFEDTEHEDEQKLILYSKKGKFIGYTYSYKNYDYNVKFNNVFVMGGNVYGRSISFYEPKNISLLWIIIEEFPFKEQFFEKMKNINLFEFEIRHMLEFICNTLLDLLED